MSAQADGVRLLWMPMLLICLTNTQSLLFVVDVLQGEVGAIRLLLRANARLMSLASVEGGAAVIAAMSSSSGARSDLRKVADRYGKTAATLAWDMQR